MVQNNIFSFSRFINLIKRHYVLNYTGLIIAFSAIAAIVAIVGALASVGAQEFNLDTFTSLFYVVMFITGYILTSMVFSEMHSPNRSVFFLTLPASSFEKLLSGWLNTSIIFLIFSLITYYVSYLLASLFTLWWFQVPFEIGNAFEMGFFEACKFYLITQSIFFFGAIYFRGYNFLKTIIALFILLLFYSIYQTLASTLAFQDIMLLAMTGKPVDEMITAPGLEEYGKNVLVPAFKIGFYYVMPAFFLSLSYIRIKEREI